MWDDQTVAVSEGGINVGDVVQIRGAYVKKGMRDALELNLGRMGNIRIIDDHEMEDLDFDVPESQTVKMNDLQDGAFDVNLVVKIGKIFNLSTFTRKSDDSEGKVLSIIGADETGSARLVFWDKYAEEMQDAKEGEVIKITGGRTKAGRYGDVEFHTTRASKVERKLKEKIDAVEVSVGAPASEPLGRKDISELTADMRDVDIEGKVARIFPFKSFERDGKEGKVQNLIVADESGTTRVTFWNDDVDIIVDLQEEDVIRIKHGYVKEGFRGGIEFHVGRRAEIKINPKGSKLAKLDLSGVSLETITRAGRVMIGDIDAESEGQTVEVCGIVVGVGQVCPVYQAICSVCGEVKKPEPRMLYKVTLDDGSGSIRVTLFGETGEELLQMTAQEAFDLISKSENNQAPIEQNTDKMLGRYIAIQGRVTKYKDSVDVAASGLDFADPVEEIKRMKQNVADMLD
jgi:ssDNA-binding replication factor A large subunit